MSRPLRAWIATMSMSKQTTLPGNAANAVYAGQKRFNGESRRIRGTLLTWTLTILACVYIVGTGIALYYSTGRFLDLYSSMNVPEFTGTAWFVFHCYRWFYPSFFGGASAFLITKEFFIRRRWMSAGITLAVSVAIGMAGELLAFALYDPIKLFQERLH
jgi:hypothetical protein